MGGAGHDQNMRESELALKTWTPPNPTLDSDVESNLGIVGIIEQIARMGSGTKSGGSSLHMPPSVGRAGVYATFRNGTSGTLNAHVFLRHQQHGSASL